MKPDFDLSYWDGDVQWTPLFGEDGLLVAKVITATKNGTSSADVETSPEEDAAAGKDRIARLVACWNACQGIENPAEFIAYATRIARQAGTDNPQGKREVNDWCRKILDMRGASAPIVKQDPAAK